MVKELAGGTITGPEIDIYPSKIEPACVTLDFDYATRLVGKHIPSDTIISILKSLEMEVTGITDKDVTVKVPTYRVDVTRPCDVVEDMLRIYGYNNVEISTTVHSSLSYKSREDEENRLRDLISEQLCGEGFNEILNNSLTREAYYTGLSQMPAENCVKLLNPLSNDLNVMRQTLLFGGLESLAHNINRRESDLLMYEFGNIYTFNPEAKGNPGDGLAPYRQYSRLAIWMSGLLRPASWARPEAEITVYDMKAVIANILRRLGISSAEIKLTTSANEIYAAGLDISTRSGKHIGSLGMLAKKILHMTDIKQPVMYAELDWNTLVGLSVKKKVTFKALPKTQAVKRDLALLLDKNVTMERVEATVRACEKHLLKEISLFDVYEGKNLPEGKKSYAITLTLQDDEKTLQDKQIEAVMNKVIAGLTRQLGAQLR